MRKLFLVASLFAIANTAAYSDTTPGATSSTSLEVTGPQEVGSTSMPAGNYLITEQTSGKCYSLMVSNKGTMILAPAPASTAKSAPTGQVAPAAQSALGTPAVKNLVEKGLQKGVTEMIEKNATNSLNKFIK